MTLHRVYGHDALLNRLEGSISSGRFPQTVLLSGPQGIGKQRLALWIAQALLCSGDRSPCGECQSCRQAMSLGHPDLHWFVPFTPGKRASDPEKQIQEAADQIAEIIAERREKPFYQPSEGRSSHSIASVRLLHRKVALKPFQGPRKVVILGDADRLVVQEGSQEAANALLKVLEEPPSDTTIIATASREHGLLPTIRSRLVPIRVQPVSDAPALEFVEREMGLAKDKAERVVAQIEGRLGAAVAVNKEAEAADRRAKEFLNAVTRGPAAWTEQALLQQPWDARGGFTALLDALAVRLRRRMKKGSSEGHGELNKYVAALRVVEEHRAVAQNNVNPQAALAVLAGQLERLPS